MRSKKQGFELGTARTLGEVDALWKDGKYDLLVLDVSLPDGSGFEFCQKVRLTSKVPIIFLTASDEETSIIMGLDIGGDDYITKPFKLGAYFENQRTASSGKFISDSGHRIAVEWHQNSFAAWAGFQKREAAGADRCGIQAAVPVYAKP